MKRTQSLPHHGVKNGYTRKGHTVCIATEKRDGAVVQTQFCEFQSISAAKRFMRTGER